MYGTVARFRVKPGKEDELKALTSNAEYERVPGWVAQLTYRLDENPNEFYIAVVFESKEAYWANAQSPEQDARYRQMRDLLDADPEWHDGEVVDYSLPGQ